MYLQENGLTSFLELEKACDAAVQKFNDLADQTKAASARMKDTSELQRNIGTYSKTREDLRAVLEVDWQETGQIL